eukprot:5071435-Amphidinium_carterae.1
MWYLIKTLPSLSESSEVVCVSALSLDGRDSQISHIMQHMPSSSVVARHSIRQDEQLCVANFCAVHPQGASAAGCRVPSIDRKTQIITFFRMSAQKQRKPVGSSQSCVKREAKITFTEPLSFWRNVHHSL